MPGIPFFNTDLLNNNTTTTTTTTINNNNNNTTSSSSSSSIPIINNNNNNNRKRKHSSNNNSPPPPSSLTNPSIIINNKKKTKYNNNDNTTTPNDFKNLLYSGKSLEYPAIQCLIELNEDEGSTLQTIVNRIISKYPKQTIITEQQAVQLRNKVQRGLETNGNFVLRKYCRYVYIKNVIWKEKIRHCIDSFNQKGNRKSFFQKTKEGVSLVQIKEHLNILNDRKSWPKLNEALKDGVSSTYFIKNASKYKLGPRAIAKSLSWSKVIKQCLLKYPHGINLNSICDYADTISGSERGIIHTALSKVLQQREIFSQGKGKNIRRYSLEAFNSNNNNNNATNNEGSSGNNNNSSKGRSDHVQILTCYFCKSHGHTSSDCPTIASSDIEEVECPYDKIMDDELALAHHKIYKTIQEISINNHHSRVFGKPFGEFFKVLRARFRKNKFFNEQVVKNLLRKGAEDGYFMMRRPRRKNKNRLFIPTVKLIDKVLFDGSDSDSSSSSSSSESDSSGSSSSSSDSDSSISSDSDSSEAADKQKEMLFASSTDDEGGDDDLLKSDDDDSQQQQVLLIEDDNNKKSKNDDGRGDNDEITFNNESSTTNATKVFYF